MNAFIFLNKKILLSYTLSMGNERVRNVNGEKTSNVCAIIGFLLTLLNIVIGVTLIITKNTLTLFIFSSITALISLTLCIVGVSNANRAGKGKAISVIGIVLNVLILLAVVVFLIFIILFAQSCAAIFQGVFQS